MNRFPIYNRFIGGATIQQAIATVANSKHKYIPIFDLAQEGSNIPHTIERYYQRLMTDLDHINPKAFVALKASSFGSYSSQSYGIQTESEHNSLKMIKDIAHKAHTNGIGILFDAETSAYTQLEDEYVLRLYKEGIPVYKTYQMYRKDGLYRLQKDLERGIINRFKLVRGAYLESDPKKDSIFLTEKSLVDASYDMGVKHVLNDDSNNYLMLATHNRRSMEAACELMRSRNLPSPNVHFAQLLGMHSHIPESVPASQRCKYIPYGSLFECLPYLVRRLYENKGMLQHMI